MADQSIKYKGHKIEIAPAPKGEEPPQVVIDGKTYTGGRDSAGRYYLDVYAFDRADSLIEVAKRYLDHLEARAAAQRRLREGEVQ